ncbi:MAG TPA: biopolymer transporter ExbD [Allosphingosinicella sp.]|nr:biopolymer transporter ExbD [Allosphingosinicella sp.]
MVRTARRRPIRTHFYAPKGDYAPIAAINTTPLIDMMLVILIMLIVAIPMTTHKVPLDLPPPVPGTPPPSHRLAVDAAGALAWDGAPLAGAALPARLAALAADPARPALLLDAADEARYERVDELLAAIRRAGVTRLGFVNTQRFAGGFGG